ncbi:peptidoglycan recognition protein family protein [Kitasatospora viridis]|uniref:Putative peptidoglycan binding protein n=1 Tax=Kitasatospora viridis TaxID=281105 RepID=A0A561UMR1_9ACTN|nr:peptidoglycan-binding domain-containing protein [Kitasatospora viridis]TWG00627.1 putative peptidoglycan binding protein [Kitasatospora viridis]
MKFVSRAEWGALPPKQPWTYVAGAQGVKIHYEGTEVPADLVDHHELCAGRVRAIQAMHLADPTQGWIDIAYSALTCCHGFVFEGRGAHHENGANGNQPLNLAHYAVCAMIGDSGLTEPNDALLDGLCDAIDWLRREGGAGSEVKGHRDGYPTECPGDPLYAWVQRGAPRPGGGHRVAVGPVWPGEYLSLRQPMLHDENVRLWQQRMADRGWALTVDGWYGAQSQSVCERFQQDSSAHGWPLTVDGIVGEQTWNAAWQRPTS